MIKKNIKQGYKKTTVGIIPEDWELKRLEGLLKDSYLGGNYNNTTEAKFHSEKTPLIKMGNIDRGKINTKHFYSIDNDVVIDEKHRLKKGDVLFNTRNTIDLVGKVAIWNDEFPIAYFNSNLLKLEFYENKVTNDFANLLLNSQSGLRQLKSFATGTTSVAAIYDRDLRRLKLPIPPLPEQKAIADCLSTWDKAIEKQTQLIEAKKEFKKGLMQGFFNGSLTVKDGKVIKAKEGEDFTEDWEEVKLGNISLKKSSSIQANKITEDSGNYNVYGATGFLTKVDFYDEDEDYIGIVKDGSGVGNMYLLEGKSSVLGTLDKILPKNVNLTFLFYLMKRINFEKYRVGGAIPHIYYRDYSNENLLIPNIEMQNAFAQVLQSTDKEIELLEQKLSALEQQKKGLMQALLTGEKRLV